MATVWASRTGKWVRDPKGDGWSHVFEFNHLSDLIGQLEGVRPSLIGQVEKLSIVAHGDSGGLIQLDPDLTAKSAIQFRPDFEKLRGFLRLYGRLIFSSCIAGAGEAGSILLCLLSREYLPNCHVIGFEVYGAVAKAGIPNRVGYMQSNQYGDPDYPSPAVTGPGNNTLLTEYAWQAKWGFNGNIIKRSFSDQNVIKHPVRTVHGVKAVVEAINKYRFDVQYVAIEGDRVAKDHKLQSVETAFIKAGLDTRNKLKFKSKAELSQLAGTSQHEGVIAVFTDSVQKFFCANPKCPSHEHQIDMCKEFVDSIPNGPSK